MAVSTPLHESPSAPSAFDESAVREPVEALFREAKRRARRPRLIVGAVMTGPWRVTTPFPDRNPLTLPQPAGLYLIDADPAALTATPSTLEPIASGHFIAATWSPDGDGIAAIDFSDSGRPLVAMRADGSESRVLVRLWPSDLFSGLAWHPGLDE